MSPQWHRSLPLPQGVSYARRLGLFSATMTVIGGIAAADRRLADRAAADPVVTRLRTAPGIGSLTAVAFVATLDAVGRFVAARTSDCPRQLVTCVR